MHTHSIFGEKRAACVVRPLARARMHQMWYADVPRTVTPQQHTSRTWAMCALRQVQQGGTADTHAHRWAATSQAGTAAAAGRATAQHMGVAFYTSKQPSDDLECCTACLQQVHAAVPASPLLSAHSEPASCSPDPSYDQQRTVKQQHGSATEQ